MTSLTIAIAGDLHGAWSSHDIAVLLANKPDAVFFVGDLGEADIRQTKKIKQTPFPTAVILGNHDRGYDRTGDFLQKQLHLLDDLHCGWKLLKWPGLPISVVGARPCSPGGGFYLSPEVQAVFGDISLEESASKISSSAEAASPDVPLVILAHSGPTGLGSEAFSPCGRDWKKPPLDWGDKDLELAISKIRRIRTPDLVVFGHMHHQLMKANQTRKTFVEDVFGVRYLNAACVPRSGLNKEGEFLSHFSWVVFNDNKLIHVSHRWFAKDTSISYQENLFNQ